ncbi:hypothetical protein JOF41_007382 [Saccharothrix coeruleofusca]|uniref:hypothetical protein n=1 Tax=Saccharothrix coeruleofusca TaxID=33919 RepID=UPI001AE64D89|nr:hypothetical protein [Saccharothrix coeruleofusca]MBP2341128.1 hypothetical protein [Saccharothrix coeruleofusca]
MAVHAPATSTWSLQLQNTAYAGRLQVGAFLAPGTADAAATRDGVLVGYSSGAVAPLDLKVIPDDTPSMWLKIYPGRAVVTRSGQGPYLHTWNSALWKVQLDNANSTNPRIDLVIVRNYDQVTNGTDAQTKGRIEVVTGTAAAVPVAPYNAIPAGVGYITLAEVTVPANASTINSGNITDKRRGTCARGGVRVLLPGDSLSDPGSYLGELTDTGGASGQLRRWNGTSWSWMAQAGVPRFFQADLLRSDGSATINGGGITDLKLYNVSGHGTTWGSVYNGRGVSLAESGLYRIHGKLLASITADNYTALRLTSTVPSYSNIIGGGNNNPGFLIAEGTEYLYIGAGQTLGFTVEAFNSSATAGTLNPNGVSRLYVEKVGEIA